MVQEMSDNTKEEGPEAVENEEEYAIDKDIKRLIDSETDIRFKYDKSTPKTKNLDDYDRMSYNTFWSPWKRR